jgi:uncharacterized damage-inducible protein DinB
MNFDLPSARVILGRTPDTLSTWLRELPAWILQQNEGSETWSAYDVVGHLIHGEVTDWIPRARMILECGIDKTFEPFDRFAQFKASRDKSLDDLLVEFATHRHRNLDALDGLQLTAEQLMLEGRHPDFGVVTLGQLIATWAVHDLDHIAQIARVLAKFYSREVGPWEAYLPVLRGTAV